MMKVKTEAIMGVGQRNCDGEEKTNTKVSNEGKTNRCWGLTGYGKYGNEL